MKLCQGYASHLTTSPYHMNGGDSAIINLFAVQDVVVEFGPILRQAQMHGMEWILVVNAAAKERYHINNLKWACKKLKNHTFLLLTCFLA